ncbi:hypothetical protein [Haliea sp. E17]|uniref:NAD(P)H-dependent amine dehydrogenase family protein n=1 Tax=Haliea sp. E17 TaxID=3401576 RepID=UPI003AB01765
MSSTTNSLARPQPGKRYRVVQWSAGRVGTSSARAIIDHPDMDLVGMWVHSAAKEGRDIGELCGVESLGITTTRSVDDIIALQPDCVMYMQEGYDADDICALLEAGINIVTSRGEFHFPPRMDQELRQRVEAACERGGATIHSSGVSPGFITEAFPLVLTSLSRRLDCLTIDEFADMTASCSDEMLLDVLRYGGTPEEASNPHLVHHMTANFGQSLGVVADALGLQLDDIQTTAENAVAKQRIPLMGGRAIEAGTVAAMRFTVAGMRNGQPLVRFRANWFCTTDLDSDWNIRENGWRVQLQGDTPLDIYIGMPVDCSAEEMPLVMAGYTAQRCVNCVPYVCAAAPGIRTSAEMPQIVSRLG